MGDTYKDLEKELYEDYRKKLGELKRAREENESVGQVFTKGILPLYIYYILTSGPSNGNEIAIQIAAHTNNRWCPSTGGIYPILKKMEKQGFVTGEVSEKGRFQKIYTLTPSGFEEYERKKELLKNRLFEALDVFKIISREIYNEF